MKLVQSKTIGVLILIGLAYSCRKEVFISEDIMYYPNPTQDDINVHIGGEDKNNFSPIF